MFNDICGTKDYEEECLANRLVSLYAIRFGIRTMVIHWSWFWEKVVLCQRKRSTKNLGQNCREDAVGIRWERMSNFTCYDSMVQRSTYKQTTWWIVDTQCSRPGHDWDFRTMTSANQLSLDGAVAEMWRVWIPSWENGATRFDGTIKFLNRAQCDHQDRSSFG